MAGSWHQVAGADIRWRGADIRWRGAGIRWRGAGIRWRGADIRWRGAGIRWRGAGIRWRGAGIRWRGADRWCGWLGEISHAVGDSHLARALRGGAAESTISTLGVGAPYLWCLAFCKDNYLMRKLFLDTTVA